MNNSEKCCNLSKVGQTKVVVIFFTNLDYTHFLEKQQLWTTDIPCVNRTLAKVKTEGNPFSGKQVWSVKSMWEESRQHTP